MSSLLHMTEMRAASDDAPVVVLLHGFLGSGRDWEGVVTRLSGGAASGDGDARGFRFVAVDLPGHGRSTSLPAGAYAWDGALDALAATLDAAGIDRCRMVGYSMGGRLALGFARRHPRRLARLVLVGASPGLRTADARAARLARDRERAAALQADFPGFLDAWYRMPLFESLDDRPALREAVVASRAAGEPAELARALTGLSTGVMPDYWADLDALGVPTLAVAGARDPKFARLAYEMAAEGLPVMPLVLPDVGHMIHLEQPALLAHVVRSFFADALALRQPGHAIPRPAPLAPST